jgi:hypothetical protein
MKNKGIIITIVLAVLVLLASAVFVMKSKTPAKDTNPIYFDNGGLDVKPTGTLSPTPEVTGKQGTSDEMNIDAELKSLDKDMGGAFDKDSDSDPTTGIN